MAETRAYGCLNYWLNNLYHSSVSGWFAAKGLVIWRALLCSKRIIRSVQMLTRAAVVRDVDVWWHTQWKRGPPNLSLVHNNSYWTLGSTFQTNRQPTQRLYLAEQCRLCQHIFVSGAASCDQNDDHIVSLSCLRVPFKSKKTEQL